MITIKDVEGYHERWWVCLWPSWRWWFYEYMKVKMKVLVAQSCVALCNPMDCSPPASTVYGILQGRILEWVAMPSSRGSSWPRYQTWISCSRKIFYPLSHQSVTIKLYIKFFFLYLWNKQEKLYNHIKSCRKSILWQAGSEPSPSSACLCPKSNLNNHP